jgi:hypothetical protein
LVLGVLGQMTLAQMEVIPYFLALQQLAVVKVVVVLVLPLVVMGVAAEAEAEAMQLMLAELECLVKDLPEELAGLGQAVQIQAAAVVVAVLLAALF